MRRKPGPGAPAQAQKNAPLESGAKNDTRRKQKQMQQNYMTLYDKQTIARRLRYQPSFGALLLNENSDMVRSATAPQASWSSRNLYQDS